MAIAKAACGLFIEEEDLKIHEEIVFNEKIKQQLDQRINTMEREKQDLEKHGRKKRERRVHTRHRLPYVGQMQIIEQFACYFKIETTVPSK